MSMPTLSSIPPRSKGLTTSSMTRTSAMLTPRQIPFSNLHGLDILNGVNAMPFVDLLWKIHRVFFVIYVEGDLPFISINNGTCSVKKRSTKNNGHAPIFGHVKHNKIGKY